MNKHPSISLLQVLLVLGLFLSVTTHQQVYAAAYIDIDVDTAYNMISGDEYPELIALDVRPKQEYDTGHIYSAIWIPYTELEARIDEIEEYRHHEIIVYAQCGCPLQDSTIAADILVATGFTKIYRMAGTSPQWGFDGWIAKGYPVWFATVHNVNTIHHYDTIQAAINSVYTLTNHVIQVEEGIYREQVIVDKTVSLIGEDRLTTIIDGSEQGTPLSVDADHVVIHGFTLQASGSGQGIHAGVLLNNTQNCMIQNSTLRNNQYGIYLLGNSSGNQISQNNFINNTTPAVPTAFTNHWFEAYPLGGNYWDIYESEDRYYGANQTILGSDGFNDFPYYIDDGNQDRYPLIDPVGDDNTPPRTVDDYVDFWHPQSFAITLTAFDHHSGVAMTYYRINSGSPYTVQGQGQPFINSDDATHILEYWSQDNHGNIEASTVITDIKLDTLPPTGSMRINYGSPRTNVTIVVLSLSAVDVASGVAAMRFSSNDETYTPWEPYVPTKPWTLTDGDGPKTVYVQYRDQAGLFNTYLDNITIDTMPPHADAGTDIMVASGSMVSFSANNSSDNFLIQSCTWSFTNLSFPPVQGSVISQNFSDIGIFEVMLTVIDGAGNTATDRIYLTVYPPESVYIEFFYYEPCPTCPVSQRQYEIYVHNSEVVDTLEEDYGSQITVNRIFFYSDKGLELVDQYDIGLENWNTLIINQEKIVFGEFNETFVREVLDAYLTQSAHDLAIQKVTVSTARIAVGDIMNVTVTIANQGIEKESCQIILYCNESNVATRNLTLTPDQQETLVLSWDTTGHQLGEYTVKAAVLPVQYEGNTINNEYVVQQKIEIATSASHTLSTMLVLAFSFGFFETFSPCLIILLSFVLSYTMGQTPQFKDNFFKIQSFGLGFIAATLLLAIAFGMFFLSMPNLQHIFTWAVSIFALLFGLNLLGFLKLPAKFSVESKPMIQKLSRNKYLKNTHIGLFILGFIFYFLDPCIAPIFVAMMPLLLQEYLGFIIFVFCLGAFLPFIGIGIFVGSVSKLVRFSYRHRTKIRAISGFILISYALYLIIFNLLPVM